MLDWRKVHKQPPQCTIEPNSEDRIRKKGTTPWKEDPCHPLHVNEWFQVLVMVTVCWAAQRRALRLAPAKETPLVQTTHQKTMHFLLRAYYSNSHEGSRGRLLIWTTLLEYPKLAYCAAEIHWVENKLFTGKVGMWTIFTQTKFQCWRKKPYRIVHLVEWQWRMSCSNRKSGLSCLSMRNNNIYI